MNALDFSSHFSIHMFINVVYVQKKRNKQDFLIDLIIFSQMNLVYDPVAVFHGLDRTYSCVGDIFYLARSL